VLIFIYIKIKGSDESWLDLPHQPGYIGSISIWFKLITNKKKYRILIILAFISAQNPLPSLLHALHKHIDALFFFYIKNQFNLRQNLSQETSISYPKKYYE
jgi:hypothetical protein